MSIQAPPRINAYERGRRMLQLYDVEGYEDCVPLFLAALAAEPGLACAHADLARAYASWAWRLQIVGLPSEAHHQSAYDHAQKALALAPGSDAAHRAMASALRAGYWRDPVRRLDEARQAYRLDPGDAENCWELWRADGSIPGSVLIERAIALDPTFCAPLIDLGAALAESGKLDEAARRLLRALELNPRNSLALYNLAMVCVRLEQPAKARALLGRALAAHPEDPLLLMGLKFAEAETP